MKRETLTLPMSDIKLNGSNPRIIKDRQMKRLVKSIQDFPEMTQLRPIVVDENNVILGGNMRYRAMQSLDYEQAEASEIKRIQAGLERALLIRQLDNTITKPIDDFIDEIEKVVENFKKRLHNGD